MAVPLGGFNPTSLPLAPLQGGPAAPPQAVARALHHHQWRQLAGPRCAGSCRQQRGARCGAGWQLHWSRLQRSDRAAGQEGARHTAWRSSGHRSISATTESEAAAAAAPPGAACASGITCWRACTRQWQGGQGGSGVWRRHSGQTWSGTGWCRSPCSSRHRSAGVACRLYCCPASERPPWAQAWRLPCRRARCSSQWHGGRRQQRQRWPSCQAGQSEAGRPDGPCGLAGRVQQAQQCPRQLSRPKLPFRCSALRPAWNGGPAILQLCSVPTTACGHVNSLKILFPARLLLRFPRLACLCWPPFPPL